jgi:hypothetical protein
MERLVPRTYSLSGVLVLALTLVQGCASGEDPDQGLPGFTNDGGAPITTPPNGSPSGPGGNPGSNPPSGPSLGGNTDAGGGGFQGGTIRNEAGVAVVPGSDAGTGGTGNVAADGMFSALSAPLPPGKDYNGWTWIDVPGSKCRDGSGAGYYWRRGKKPSLMVFLNGGGACADPFFCGLNPVNVDQNLPIELLIEGALNLVLGPDAERQVAPDEGVFKRDPRNPVADWNMVYVPYCTGDIHSGSREDVEVEGVPGKQQFVGYKNLGLFLNSFGPSFKNAQQVLLTGSSAGGFGSLLNYDRFQEYFKGQEVLAITDSGVAMRDKYMAPCLQGKWRTYWALNDAFPKECTDCQGQAGGLAEAAYKYYFSTKYKGRFLGGMISSVHDQIIRAFFAPGQSVDPSAPDDCTLEPSFNTISSSFSFGDYDGEKYRQGLVDVADNLVSPEQMGFYAMEGELHMHLFRPRFYEKNGNTQTIAEWMTDILAKKPTKQGENFLRAM